MSSVGSNQGKLSRLCATVAVAAALVGTCVAQQGHIGVPQDWSTRHMIFTNLSSPEKAAAVADDPRAWIHWAQHTSPLLRAMSRQSGRVLDGAEPEFDRFSTSTVKGKQKNSKIDWAISLGNNGGMPVAETPAKYSFDISLAPDCTKDFVVYVIAATPGAGQANIVAFNNLYNGTGTGQQTCGGTDPNTMWSYRVGNGPNFLSPVLSLDGKKVAFISSSTPNATFNVLTWVAGQGSSPTSPVLPGSGGSSVISLDYTNTATAGCTANAAADSNSSPFIDYKNNAAYVGADNGKLYRIKNVFSGTPTVDYCITVSANRALTSPVYDSFAKKVFVSDGQSVFGFTPGASSFTAAGSIQVAGTPGSIILSPMVDGFNGWLYVFSGNNLANTNTIVSQMPTTLASHVDVLLGPSFNGQYILDGDFDNKYYNNGPATGTLYACGTQAGSNAKPALYAMSFAANGVINTTPAVNGNIRINAGTNPDSVCSPLFSFFDGTTDRLFVGTGSINSTTGSNMVTMWNITNRLASATTAPTATATGYAGGSSAFTIDNNATSVPQAASIYFGTLAPGGSTASGTRKCGANNYCAVKLTQSVLQ